MGLGLTCGQLGAQLNGRDDRAPEMDVRRIEPGFLSQAPTP